MATTRHMSAPKEFHRYANTRHMQITRQNCLHNGGLTECVIPLMYVGYGTLQGQSPIDVKGMLHRAAATAHSDSAPEPPRPAATSAFSDALPQASSTPGRNAAPCVIII